MIAAALAAIACAGPIAWHDGDSGRPCGVKARLWGMDAAEMPGSPRCRRPNIWACDPEAMRWAIPARDRLIELSRDGVECEPVNMDRDHRIVVRCTARGVDLNRELVREGLARDYTRYSHGAYLAEETRARRDRVGMWTGK